MKSATAGRQRGLGHAMTADKHRRDYLVRSSAQELSLGGLIVGAGDDVQVRIQSARGEHYVNIFRVGRGRCDQRFRGSNPRAFEHGFVGRVTDQNQMAFGQQLFGYHFIAFDDDIIDVFSFQLVDDAHSDAARAAQDVMIFQLTDVFEQFASPKN
jgi:hypothetical protein